MNTQQEKLDVIKTAILAAFAVVWKFQLGKRLKIGLLCEALKRTLINAGHTVRLNQSISIQFESKPLGYSETIDLVVDNLVGICIVRGKSVSENQRNSHRILIEQAGLPLAFVVTLDGASVRYLQIDVPSNRKEKLL